MLRTNRFEATRVARAKALDLWYGQNKQELSLDVSARLLTNLNLLLRNINGIKSARNSELEDASEHAAQYEGRIPTSSTCDREESIYIGQARRAFKTVDQCFMARMKSHYRGYLVNEHWNPKEYAALCDPPHPPVPPSRALRRRRGTSLPAGGTSLPAGCEVP
jgi:hypothetical protein